MHSLGSARLVFAVAFTVLIVISIAFGGGSLAGLLTLQLGPSLLALAAGQTTAGLAVVAVIFAATVVFGRFYCAWLCPLGIFQECIGYLKKQKTKALNPRHVRYIIACISFLLLAGGWTIGFKMFDPLTRTGSMVSTAFVLVPQIFVADPHGYGWLAIIAGTVSFIGFVALGVWKNRIYCTAICPVGTALGLLGKFSVFKIRFTDSCAGCGKCEAVCQMDCIDTEARQIDSERCITCLNCLSVCRVNGISYSLKPHSPSQPVAPADAARRTFLGTGAVIAASVLVSGHGLKGVVRTLAVAGERIAGKVLPPGAGNPDLFYQRCTGCQICVASCPTGIIKPSMLGFGPVYLDYSTAACDYNCNKCGSVCPTGALEKLPLEEKRYTRIGIAEVELNKCLVATTNEPCDLCAKACPVGTIFMVEGSNGLPVPEVNAYHCIGCGACHSVCPSHPHAVVVKAIDEQHLM